MKYLYIHSGRPDLLSRPELVKPQRRKRRASFADFNYLIKKKSHVYLCAFVCGLSAMSYIHICMHDCMCVFLLFLLYVYTFRNVICIFTPVCGSSCGVRGDLRCWPHISQVLVCTTTGAWGQFIQCVRVFVISLKRILNFQHIGSNSIHMNKYNWTVHTHTFTVYNTYKCDMVLNQIGELKMCALVI